MRPYDQELVLCKRYYNKTFSYGTKPANNAGAVGVMVAMTYNYSTSIAAVMQWWFSTPMRTTPTVTNFNPYNTGNGYATDLYGNTLIYDMGPATANECGARWASPVSGGTSLTPAMHATADARL
jgi:uncharacterized protein YaiE (UPF0345 family)